MGKKDTIDNKYSIIMLDKARIVKITMRALFQLEEIYGTVWEAFNAIRDWDNSTRLCQAVINFLYAVAGGVTIPEIEQYLTVSNIVEIHKTLLESLARDMPNSDAEENMDSKTDTGNEYDWDILYYRAHFHLDLSEEEFWNATPRKYIKLLQLWDEAHGIEHEAKKEFYVDEIPW